MKILLLFCQAFFGLKRDRFPGPRQQLYELESTATAVFDYYSCCWCYCYIYISLRLLQSPIIFEMWLAEESNFYLIS